MKPVRAKGVRAPARPRPSVVVGGQAVWGSVLPVYRGPAASPPLVSLQTEAPPPPGVQLDERVSV